MNANLAKILAVLARMQIVNASMQHALIATAAAVEKGTSDDAMQKRADQIGQLHKGMEELHASYRALMGTTEEQ